MKMIFYYNPGRKFISPPTDWFCDRVVNDLTIGKEYTVWVVPRNNYSDEIRCLVSNDEGYLGNYPLSLFTSVDIIRNNKLEELGI